MNTTPHSQRKIIVGVLRGGPSDEYEVSLQSGGAILQNLPAHYSPVDIFISRDGTWHVGGIEKTPDKILPHVDVVWNALRGYFGEDGKVQKILEAFHVPFTGSNSFPSAMGQNKNIAKALFQYHGLKTPNYTVVHPHENTNASLVSLFQSTPQPSIIKPISGGSSIGITKTTNFASFKEGIEMALKKGGSAVVEEYIPGLEVMCAVYESADGKTLISLKPILVGSHGSNGTVTPPSSLTDSEATMIQEIAMAVHKHFGLRHYSAVDIILHPTKGPHLLEVNTSPSFSKIAPFQKALSHSSLSIESFIDHVISLALKHNIRS